MGMVNFANAECAKLSPTRAMEVFYEDPDPEPAKAMCRSCPALMECREAGWREPAGVWGGTDPEQRRRRLRANREPRMKAC